MVIANRQTMVLPKSSPRVYPFLCCIHPRPSARLVPRARVLLLQEASWLCCNLEPELGLRLALTGGKLKPSRAASGWASQGEAEVQNPLFNVEDVRDSDSVPGLRRSPGEGNSSPLQYSCLENPMDGGVW